LRAAHAGSVVVIKFEHTRKRANDAKYSAWNAGDGAGGVRCRWIHDGVPMMISESTSSTVDLDPSSAAVEDFTTRFHSDLIPLLEPLYARAMRLTRNRADAEDLLQDTMVKACASLRSGNQNTNLRGWLFRIMTNTHTDNHRKRRRRPLHYTTDFTAETAVTQHSAEEHVLNTLGHSGIRAAMCALPEQFRLAVYYADVEGFGYREIAELMQTPVGTVTSRVHRGRRLLRRLLADVAEQRGVDRSPDRHDCTGRGAAHQRRCGAGH
jgi:RNA polymerase sigma-70 factor, ECF subfamily